MTTVLIAVVCIALLVRVTLTDANAHKQSERKEEYRFFLSSALYLIYDFKTHQYGIVLSDSAEVIE